MSNLLRVLLSLGIALGFSTSLQADDSVGIKAPDNTVTLLVADTTGTPVHDDQPTVAHAKDCKPRYHDGHKNRFKACLKTFKSDPDLSWMCASEINNEVLYDTRANQVSNTFISCLKIQRGRDYTNQDTKKASKNCLGLSKHAYIHINHFIPKCMGYMSGNKNNNDYKRAHFVECAELSNKYSDPTRDTDAKSQFDKKMRDLGTCVSNNRGKYKPKKYNELVSNCVE